MDNLVERDHWRDCWLRGDLHGDPVGGTSPVDVIVTSVKYGADCVPGLFDRPRMPMMPDWHPASLGQDVALAAIFAPVGRVGTDRRRRGARFGVSGGKNHAGGNRRS